MPELAEVEYYRKQWNPGVGGKIRRVALHHGKRIFRGSEVRQIEAHLTGATLRSSATHGKQMLFRFSGGNWLGVHLGMTGRLRVAPASFVPGSHDHLVLYQSARALVFEDARMFGRARFHHGKEVPPWWSDLPPEITSPKFTAQRLEEIFERRRSAPLKAVLLAQEVFPGIGNWMADEILWQLKLPPRIKTGDVDAKAIRQLWKTTRAICRTAIKTIGVDWGDPPKSWLLHQRFKSKGTCPRDGTPLKKCIVATRTTVFCAVCQKDTANEALCDDGDRTESGS